MLKIHAELVSSFCSESPASQLLFWNNIFNRQFFQLCPNRPLFLCWNPFTLMDTMHIFPSGADCRIKFCLAACCTCQALMSCRGENWEKVKKLRCWHCGHSYSTWKYVQSIGKISAINLISDQLCLLKWSTESQNHKFIEWFRLEGISKTI